MKRKGIAALLAICMLGSLLTGCGNDSSKSPSNSSDYWAPQNNAGYSYNGESYDDGSYDAGFSYEANDALSPDMVLYEEWDESMNSEEYSTLTEQGFFSVYREPLSTFSADVDTSSYSNLRRMIQDGYSISNLPEGAVRIDFAPTGEIYCSKHGIVWVQKLKTHTIQCLQVDTP